jgi:uncharacterized protein
MKPFQATQLAFTEYLRGPEMGEHRSRQQEIYRDSIYKNINQCIADVFPITRSIIPESEWELLIREFIHVHRLQTPYFLEICQEFLAYFMHTRKSPPTDYPFILELAHFEWIQLALNIADMSFPEYQHNSAPTENSQWKASPLVVGLIYSYPVHIIDEHYLPAESAINPTYLLAYRNRSDDVQIVETDNLSLRIIQLLQAHENITHLQIAQLLSSELNDYPHELLLAKTLTTLCMLAEQEIIFYE